MSSTLQNLAANGQSLTAAQFVENAGLWEATARDGRPRVVAAMIGSADGRATVGGGAGGLGSPADRAVLRELRAAADALLVGPGTLIAERYATLLDDDQAQRRIDRGRSPEPLMATISRSLDARLADVPLFAEQGLQGRVFTESAGAQISAAAQVRIERFAPGTLSTRACLESLAREGVRLVVSEGGPTLLRELVADGLVDDLILTLAPLLVAGEGRSVLHGGVLDPPARMQLCEVMRAGDHLFLHYAVEPRENG